MRGPLSAEHPSAAGCGSLDHRTIWGSLKQSGQKVPAGLSRPGHDFTRVVNDIVDVTTFHTDPEAQFGMIMAVKNKVFGVPPYPNWTAVGVNWLAGFDFEIKVIARILDPV